MFDKLSCNEDLELLGKIMIIRGDTRGEMQRGEQRIADVWYCI
jgi:hypothetical protein